MWCLLEHYYDLPLSLSYYFFSSYGPLLPLMEKHLTFPIWPCWQKQKQKQTQMDVVPLNTPKGRFLSEGPFWYVSFPCSTSLNLQSYKSWIDPVVNKRDQVPALRNLHFCWQEIIKHKHKRHFQTKGQWDGMSPVIVPCLGCWGTYDIWTQS